MTLYVGAGTRHIEVAKNDLVKQKIPALASLAWQIGGPGLSPRSWGHMGFTGTSVWVDEGRIFVLLTNRVHASRARRPAKVIADVRADVADAASLAVMDFGSVASMPLAFRADRAEGWNAEPATRKVVKKPVRRTVKKTVKAPKKKTAPAPKKKPAKAPAKKA